MRGSTSRSNFSTTPSTFGSWMTPRRLSHSQFDVWGLECDVNALEFDVNALEFDVNSLEFDVCSLELDAPARQSSASRAHS
mmetsp:Transcript_25282/g.57751  ORF Transcript_25282/g.57751 Transcript_25282/m.57751 type:complete len:81 (-) Transcript_25282:105-347(-)